MRSMPSGRILCNAVFRAVLIISIGTSCGKDSVVKPDPSYAISACAWPVWSPDRSFIAYSHVPLRRIDYDKPTNSYTYVFCESLTGFYRVDPGGSNERMLLPGLFRDPDWTTDGRYLAYESGGNIWSAPASGDSIDLSGAIQITGSGDSFHPSWNPSGTLISFSVNAGPIRGIYTIPITGGAARLIGSLWIEPDWSPDGTKFAFVGDVGGQSGIGVCDSSGANAHIVRTAGVRSWFPKWSPDGTKIGFTERASESDKIQLWVMSGDGSGATQLTTSGTEENFTWSPDGTEIAYVQFDPLSHVYSNGIIAVRNLMTGSTRAVTTNPSCGP